MRVVVRQLFSNTALQRRSQFVGAAASSLTTVRRINSGIIMHQGVEQRGEREEVTGLVCQESDLRDGQMKEVSVEDQKVLLVRTKGQYSAVGSRCSHYNAPLIKGTLVGERVRCPFHGACFNVRTGDIEEYPGLDCLPTYKNKTKANKEARAKPLGTFKK